MNTQYTQVFDDIVHIPLTLQEFCNINVSCNIIYIHTNDIDRFPKIIA